jgi:hypothetical protein
VEGAARPPARAELLEGGAAGERDEPAALFYVFSKAWARLGDACAVLPDLLARNHARAVGLELAASPDEQRALRLRIAEGGVPFDEVRSWFSQRLRPPSVAMGGPESPPKPPGDVDGGR